MKDAAGSVQDTEARLYFGVASHEQLREGVRRLGLAAQEVLPQKKIVMPTFAGCKA